MTMKYNDPNGNPSDIGTQAQTAYWQKTALIEARKTQFFSQLADVTAMPKHFGKKIKRYHYIPMLDDANINDQGIDAAGVAISMNSFEVTVPRLVVTFATDAAATSAAAAANAVSAGSAAKTGAGPFTVTFNKKVFPRTTDALSATLTNAVPGSYRRQGSGNLYGSSKDIGTISGKMPVLSETGGRVNRVGFKRKEIEGNLEKFGFFDEYTQESLDFDSDADLMQHINREMINGANEITEDLLQIDLINAAGLVKFAGDALQTSELGANDLVTYGDLMKLSIDLDNNRTPKQTKVITGTRMVDTRVVPSGRVAYIGSELIPTIRAMKDLHGEPAFIPVEKYAAGAETLVGEIGVLDQFHIIVVPEMMKWAGAGAAKTDDLNYDNGAYYDVFPILVVGGESFSTIGFQTDGKTVKFKIMHKAPGEATADRTDPYGETGFMSIKWYYGFLALRPERIALIKTVARM